MRCYPQQLFAIKTLATERESTAHAAALQCSDVHVEAGTVSYETLMGRVGSVPRIQPSVIPCLAGAMSRALSFALGQPRPYCIVCGSSNPIVNGAYVRLRSVSAGAPIFAQLGRGVPVFLFKVRVDSSQYRWVIEQPHARIFESVIRADDDADAAGGIGGGWGSIGLRASLSGVTSAIGNLASTRHVLQFLHGADESLASVTSAADVPPVLGWSSAERDEGRLVVVGGDLVVSARDLMVLRSRRFCARIGTW